MKHQHIGACDIEGCKRPATRVDHLHDPSLPKLSHLGWRNDGPIRGNLCSRHNMLAQDPEELRRVLAYIERPISPDARLYSDHMKDYRREWYAQNRARLKARPKAR